MVTDASSFNTQHYKVRVKWSNPGKGVAPSPTPWCSSYRKGRLWVTLDYWRQLYFLPCVVRYEVCWAKDHSLLKRDAYIWSCFQVVKAERERERERERETFPCVNNATLVTLPSGHQKNYFRNQRMLFLQYKPWFKSNFHLKIMLTFFLLLYWTSIFAFYSYLLSIKTNHTISLWPLANNL